MPPKICREICSHGIIVSHKGRSSFIGGAGGEKVDPKQVGGVSIRGFRHKYRKKCAQQNFIETYPGKSAIRDENNDCPPEKLSPPPLLSPSVVRNEISDAMDSFHSTSNKSRPIVKTLKRAELFNSSPKSEPPLP
ncbi:hypothetical protein TNIN_119361 [Trichonephila inaurata madagascariensis]|uniref:Uncharacterized protein n=1 Tax=Trichonephila inaurata madagascariensis TaxID=2747483 RepID=A0A8X7C3T2_9ARAC|nr:hypothetical protein TNIN_119361 [Trichonephila inaurata madagascariensis]